MYTVVSLSEVHTVILLSLWHKLERLTCNKNTTYEKMLIMTQMNTQTQSDQKLLCNRRNHWLLAIQRAHGKTDQTARMIFVQSYIFSCFDSYTTAAAAAVTTTTTTLTTAITTITTTTTTTTTDTTYSTTTTTTSFVTVSKPVRCHRLSVIIPAWKHCKKKRICDSRITKWTATSM